MVRTRRHLAPALVALVLLSACAGNSGPATPQAKVAHYSTTVLQAVDALQKGVTAAATSTPSFVPTARQYTVITEKIYTRAGQLENALKAYDAAATLDLKRIAETEVHLQIGFIQGLLQEAFGIKISDATGAEVANLIINVAKVVTTLQAELAKVRLPTTEPAPAPAVR